ncbi:hypothetical protein K502DRAFT_322474, partial [Neoconidiobolus thromboides FSU 785]
MSFEDIKKDFEKVDKEVQQELPIYKSMMSKCNELIEKYETCLEENTSMNPSVCMKEENAKDTCVSKNLCPQEYINYQLCLQGDKSKCRDKRIQLVQCQQNIWLQIDKLTKEIWKKYKANKDWDL